MEIIPANQYSFITSFFRKESAGGILLMLMTVLAIIVANSPFEPYYQLLLSVPVNVSIGALSIDKPLLLWINDGLMAVFFFHVGLELKSELTEGQLADRRAIILPGIGAVGGMAVPALIYAFCNWGNPLAIHGWAIPAATDIAFALGTLSLLGTRVPVSIKVFLTSLAIFDDIGAILIIAMFYTANISLTALGIALLCLPVLYLMNRYNVTANSPYVLIGTIIWVALLKSGIHATLAGVIVAMFIPMRSRDLPNISPVKIIAHDLHPIVAYFVLPVFAFANTGLNVSGMTIAQVIHGVPVGIAAGLFFGKQIGIFLFCWALISLTRVRLPNGMNWAGLYGTAALCGIGFTMSLFIGSLAFEETGQNNLFDERLGIIVGSLASGLFGYFLLNITLPKPRPEP